MNGFDLALLAVVVLSTLFAFVRGVVRELIAAVTWIVAIVAAVVYADPVAGWFARLDLAPVAKHLLAFGLILIAILVVGAFVATALSGVVRAIGLGFVDRVLGAAFGLARGLAVVVLFALVAGVTALPRHDWWQNSMFGGPLAVAALALKPWLPRAWAERLDFGGARTTTARPRAGPLGEPPCAES